MIGLAGLALLMPNILHLFWKGAPPPPGLMTPKRSLPSPPPPVPPGESAMDFDARMGRVRPWGAP